MHSFTPITDSQGQHGTNQKSQLGRMRKPMAITAAWKTQITSPKIGCPTHPPHPRPETGFLDVALAVLGTGSVKQAGLELSEILLP